MIWGRAFALPVCALCIAILALSAPSAARAATPVSALTSGVGYMCALTSTGGVECWGWNYYGQLGVGTDTGPDVCGYSESIFFEPPPYPIGCATTPVAVSGLGSGVSALAAGYASTCALTDSGGVLCWGYNTEGGLGDGMTEGPEGCGEYPVGCSMVPVPVSGLGSGVSAIGAGWEHACAVLSTGVAECWGYNADGELGDGTTTNSSTAVAVQLPDGVKVTAIASGGGYHTCALTSEGGVLCWGYNDWGELGDGTDEGPQTCGNNKPCSTTPVAVQLPVGVTATAVVTGDEYSCALTSAGGVECWGRNEDGELGDGTASVDSSTPVAVRLPPGVTATAIASKADHTCVVTSEGEVLCWGENYDGQLGDGTYEGPEDCGEEDWCSTVPVAVSGLAGAATAVAVTEESTCALLEAGGVECWGFSRNGALGDGQGSGWRESLVPVQVIGLNWSMSVSTSGAGSGTVSSSPAGIDCGGAGHTSCGGLFAPGSTVLLRATPAVGSGFAGFTGGGCSGGSACEVSMSEARSVTATFAIAPSASITAPASGGTYTVGESVGTSFSCAEGESGPGLSSCADSTGAHTVNGGSGHLDTSTPGTHTYTVTATSKDGQTGTAGIAYTVAPAPEMPGTGTSPSATTPGSETPGPETPAPEIPAPRPALQVSIRSGSALVVGGHTKVGLRCAGGASGSVCRGELSLTVSRRIVRRVDRRRRVTRETIVLARARYEVRSGHETIVVVRLTRAGLKLLAGQSPPATVQAKATLSGGRAAHRTLALRLERSRGVGS